MLDAFILQADSALRTLFVNAPKPARESPAQSLNEPELTPQERELSASLMRINHTGEVCAQALYRGQAHSANQKKVAETMQQAADEEADHLAWCEQRINELGSHTSYLNPIFYSLSYALGYTTGKISDEISLGFIGATEDQVCLHLENHSERLPKADAKSQAIVKQMIIDEKRHGEHAMQAGGKVFPKPVKQVMSLFSKVMTETTSKI